MTEICLKIKRFNFFWVVHFLIIRTAKGNKMSLLFLTFICLYFDNTKGIRLIKTPYNQQNSVSPFYKQNWFLSEKKIILFRQKKYCMNRKITLEPDIVMLDI